MVSPAASNQDAGLATGERFERGISSLEKQKCCKKTCSNGEGGREMGQKMDKINGESREQQCGLSFYTEQWCFQSCVVSEYLLYRSLLAAGDNTVRLVV